MSLRERASDEWRVMSLRHERGSEGDEFEWSGWGLFFFPCEKVSEEEGLSSWLT